MDNETTDQSKSDAVDGIDDKIDANDNDEVDDKVNADVVDEVDGKIHADIADEVDDKLDADDNDSNSSDVFMPTSLCKTEPSENHKLKVNEEKMADINEESPNSSSENLVINDNETTDEHTILTVDKTKIALSMCDELSINLEPIEVNKNNIPKEISSPAGDQDEQESDADEPGNQQKTFAEQDESTSIAESEANCKNENDENIKHEADNGNEEHNLSDDFKIGLAAESTEEKLDPSLAKATYEDIENNIYLIDKKKSRSSKEVRRMQCECPYEPDDPCFIGCGESCLNRLLMIECSRVCPTGDFCTNRNFQIGCQYNIEIFHAGRKGWGLKTNENISKGSFVIEYCGEVVDYNEFHNRTQTYAAEGIHHYYFMTLKTNEIIDATKKGCKSRFINHSCDPNCVTQKWTVNGFLRVGFFALRHIKAGEELSFDYQFQRYGEKPQECFCGSAICRGVIGSEQSNALPSYLDKIMTGTPTSSSKKKGRKEQMKEFYESELAKELNDLLGQKWELKNQEQTLDFIRLMVQVEALHERQELLKILQSSTDQALLKTFVKYKGLSLLWSWMVDAPEEKHKYKREILRTLKHIPIPNKNELDDSKILNVMSKWATPPSPLGVKSDDTLGDETQSGSDNELRIDEGGSTSQDESSKEDTNDELLKKKKKTTEHETSEDGDTQEGNSNSSQKKQKKKTKKKKENLEKKHERREEIAFLSASLIEDWKELKEVFKIPKKSQTPDRRSSKADVTEADSPTLSTLPSDSSSSKSEVSTASHSVTTTYESPDSTIHKKRQSQELSKVPKGLGAYLNMTTQDGNNANSSSYPDSSTDSNNRFNNRNRQYDSRDWRKSPDRNNRYTKNDNNDRWYNRQHDYDNRRGRYNDWNRNRRYNNSGNNRYNRNNYRDNNSYKDNFDRNNSHYDDNNVDYDNKNMNNDIETRGNRNRNANLNNDVEARSNRNHNVNDSMNWHRNQDIQPTKEMQPANWGNAQNWPNGQNHFQQRFGHPQVMPGIHPLPAPNRPPMVPPLIPPPQPPIFPANPPSVNPAMVSQIATPNPIFPNQVSAPSSGISQQQHGALLPQMPDQQHYNPTPSQPQQQAFNPSPSTPPVSFSNQTQFQHSPAQAPVSALNVVNQLQLLLNAERLKSSAPNTPDMNISTSNTNSPKPSSEPTSPKPKSSPLPPHWKTATDSEGRLYYYHAITRETSWDPPVAPPPKHFDEKKKSKKRHSSDTPNTPPSKYSPRQNRHSPRIAAADTTHHQGPKTPPISSSKSKSDIQKIKESFKVKMSSVVVNCLNAYQKVDCKQGRIKTQDDFKFLARKLTHGLIVKEIQRIKREELLSCNDSVKMKVKEYIRNYMKKFGPYYVRS